MEQLSKPEQNNLALMLLMAAKRMPIMEPEARDLATKLGVIERYEFLEAKFPGDMMKLEVLLIQKKPGEN